MEKITVVKIGGNVIDDPAALRGFLADFASLPGAKILVHGGGKLATRLAQKGSNCRCRWSTGAASPTRARSTS